ANPAEQMRIGQRALDGVALARQGGVKVLERGVERLDAARIQRTQLLLAADDLQRGALLRARLAEKERAVRKLERGEDHLRSSTRLLPRLAPGQTAGDHQVDDEEQRFVFSWCGIG